LATASQIIGELSFRASMHPPFLRRPAAAVNIFDYPLRSGVDYPPLDELHGILFVQHEVFVFASKEISSLSRLSVFQRREATRPRNKITNKLLIMAPPAIEIMEASLLRCDISFLKAPQEKSVKEIHRSKRR
jgi:hypothetical protein